MDSRDDVRFAHVSLASLCAGTCQVSGILWWSIKRQVGRVGGSIGLDLAVGEKPDAGWTRSFGLRPMLADHAAGVSRGRRTSSRTRSQTPRVSFQNSGPGDKGCLPDSREDKMPVHAARHCPRRGSGATFAPVPGGGLFGGQGGSQSLVGTSRGWGIPIREESVRLGGNEWGTVVAVPPDVARVTDLHLSNGTLAMVVRTRILHSCQQPDFEAQAARGFKAFGRLQ